MNYPDWAPTMLVNDHKRKVKLVSDNDKKSLSDPDVYIEELRKQEQYKTFTAEAFENLRQQLWRTSLDLPNNEAIILLEKLITDQRMKEVWASLLRHKVGEKDAFYFWRSCELAIIGWRGEPKIANKEKQNILKEIQNSAAKLQSNIHKLSEFEFYSINKLIDDESVKWLLKVLDSDLNIKNESVKINHARLSLADVIPTFDEVLMDVHSKAKILMSKELIVKKPNSENAEIHYFARKLSGWLKGYFGQPLHDVVAITSSVALDAISIDSDYVRKLVNK